MGWLMTVVLALPLAASDVEFQMWFSKESYCKLAIEKFAEKPFLHRLENGTEAPGDIKSATCRELSASEEALVPEHLLWKVRPFGGLLKND